MIGSPIIIYSLRFMAYSRPDFDLTTIPNEFAEKPGPDLCLFINYSSVFYYKTKVR